MKQEGGRFSKIIPHPIVIVPDTSNGNPYIRFIVGDVVVVVWRCCLS